MQTTTQTATIQGFRLSPQQLRLWRLHGRDDRPYRARAVVQVEGALDPATLEAALAEVVARHEILRTRFVQLAGMAEPLQEIDERAALGWSVHDAPLETLWERAASLVFDLERGPLLDAALVRLDAERALVVLALPALCADVAGLENLVRQIADAYAGLRGESAEGEEPIQYADVAEWLYELGESPEAEPGRALWRRRLAELATALERGPELPLFGPAAACFEPALLELGPLEGAPSTAALAAWQALLARLGGGETLGLVSAGRGHAELAEALGPLERTLPLVCRPAPGLSFEGLLAALEHEQRELERWRDAFGLEATDAPTPPCGFRRRAAQGALVAGGLRWSVTRAEAPSWRFALELEIVERGDERSARLWYDAARLAPEDAARWGERWRTLLATALEAPATPLAELPLLGPVERRHLLAELNATAHDFETEARLEELVAAQTARSPEAVALSWAGGALSYAELVCRSRALAAELRAGGAGAETVVALRMERSPEQVIALLGVLASGAAFLPLDPEHPDERIAQLLADSGARRLEDVGAGEAAPATGDAGLAYVIYTSGSTGRPKGVMVTHAALRNRLLWMQRVFPLGPDDVVLHKTPLTFDAALWELFCPLFAGARVTLAPSAAHRDPAGLVAAVQGQRATVLQLVPSLVGAFLDAARGAPCPSLRRLFCGGEELARVLAERAAAQLPGLWVCNLYGPTETAIDASFQRFEPSPDAGAVPIGRPLDNVRVYLLDRRGEPVPTGAPGELTIGGAGLARGYRGRPAATAAVFVPDPFGQTPGARLYRSGDLARTDRAGRLVYAGRIDHQLKLRGVRIEPGEIEAALAGHPQIAEAAVRLWGSSAGETAGEKHLAAYAVPRAGASAPAGAELRRYLETRLPRALVPETVVVLEALPRLPSGKLDRAALPEPSAARAEASFTAPRTLTEELLAGIWCELLGVERVGVEESFFELGGHSLSATQLVSRLRAELGVEIALRGFFDTPTIAGLASAVEQARREQTGLATPPIVALSRSEEMPRGEAAEMPLSFAQQRLWFLDQWEPGSPAYNIVLALAIDGPLELGVLRRALGEVVRRHESLRTRFPARRGRPVQVIAPPEPARLPLVDGSALAPATRADWARRLAETEARRPFDLARGPLLRALLLRTGPDEHVACINQHHIVSDGWSTTVLVRELGALYAAFLRAEPSPLPELAIQYADFARWQREWLRGEVLERQLGYWRHQLAGVEPLELPTDRARPAVQTFRGARCDFAFPAGLAERLGALGRPHGATLFMTLLALFKTLLHRLSEQTDVVVGAPVAARNRAEIEGLIGFFINALVLRSDCGGDPRFSTLIERVREVALAASAHQDVPFEQLVEAVQPSRDLAHNPFFQVVFVLQNAPLAGVALPGLELRPLRIHNGTGKFDLILDLSESPAGLEGNFEYNTDLFEPTTIQRLARRLLALAAAVVEAPRTRLAQLPLLAAAERHQLVREWNDTATSFDGGLRLHELFAAQARRTPAAPAVVFEGATWSYAELAAHTHRLAHRLRALGVGPGVMAGVHLPRCAEMVAAVLAVLEAGGAYVPIETSLPPLRIRALLERLEPPCLITASARLEALGEVVAGLAAPPELVALDAPATRAALAALPADAPPPELPSRGADEVAYVIFTSGSTGAPKGVVVRHRPVLNLIAWANRRFGLGAGDRVLFITSLSFDLSVYDVFGLLAAGGSIHVAAERDVGDPQRLLHLLTTEPITFWDSAPAALQQLVPFLPAPGTLAGSERLRLVFLSGDWVPLGLPDALRTRFGGARVIALGGATEATVWSNVFAVGEVAPWWVSIPYGRPIANARYHVLDARLEPRPIGTPGDLFIGGECLAAGYAREPQLSAWKFLPDPFGGTGGRLYRTGDRARVWGDGLIEFLGRRDQQVKIRGFRIELGEIEGALAEHPAVADAVASLRTEGGEKRLVAWVVPAAGAVLDPAELRAHLKERLPAPMLPSAIVALDALPVTANGKLDRAALARRPLPAPAGTGAGAAASSAADAVVLDATEQALAEVWCEQLGVARVRVEDDFFELGGHSLLAAQVVAEINARFGVALGLRDLFLAPTLRALARRIEAAAPARAEAIVRRPAGTPAPLSFAQRRLWFLEKLVPGSAAYNLALLLRIEGALEPAALAAAWADLRARHEVLRVRFSDRGEQPVQSVEPLEVVGLPRVELGALTPARRERELLRLARLQSSRPFDLKRRTPLRTALVRLDGGTHALLTTLHHILADGWSLGLIVDELAEGYAARLERRAPRLPALPIQYPDFAVWQQGRLRGEHLERLLGYWRERLAGMPQVLELPTDRPRPPVQSLRGGSVEIRWPAELGAAALGLVPPGGTLFMVLAALFAGLLGRLGGRRDLALGTPVAGRTRPETRGLVGLFVNTLVLRTDLGGEPSTAELIERIRTTLPADLEHEELPFERLLDALQPERTLAHTPLFQVMLVLQNTPEGGAEIPGLELRPFFVDNGSSKFDLTLDLGARGEQVAGALVYDSALFDRTSVVRLARQLEHVLGAAARAPELPFAELPLLGAGERHQLVVEWNDTRRHDPQGAERLDEAIAAQARRTPDAIALVSESGALTYGELLRRADRLAARLAALGVGPDTVVAVATERSLELSIALLGVLRAGAAYLPLDRDYPEQRLAFMLDDAGVSVLLGPPGGFAGFAGHRLEVEPAPAPTEAEATPPASAARAGADHLAYTIYTSGSTGRPKGAQISHRAIANRLVWMQQTYGLGQDDRVLQKTPTSFDVSVWELFWPLLVGARLVMLRPGGHRDPDVLMAAIARERITTLHFVPSMLRAFLDARGLERCAPLRRVFASGEALAEDLRRCFVERLGAELHNLYGPTEAAVDVSFQSCRDLAAGGAVPIGRPIANLVLRVLDARLRPLPPGAAGQLMIGGVGLARCYLRRPAQTAERFVPDPLAEHPGERLYATGDLARHRADGALEYLGRIDHQVKVRGMRIELGEIEAVLAEHPAVRTAVVLPAPDASQRLIAFVVAKTDAPAEETLRGFVRTRLPEHMVPAAVLALAELPTTANGKLDRARLLARVAPAAAPAGAVWAPPRDAFETALCAIWAAVLGVERVGIDDNFYSLGGDSIRSLQVVNGARAEGLEIDFQQMYQHPTIRALSAARPAAPDAGTDTGTDAGTDTDAELAALLAQVEGMDEGELDALLEEGVVQGGGG